MAKKELPAVSGEARRCEVYGCGAPPLKTGPRCVLHDPTTKEMVRKARADHEENRAQIETELMGHTEFDTNKGLVKFGGLAIRAFLAKVIDQKEANTLGFLLNTQLTGVARANEEKDPSVGMQILLGNGQVQINMTREERKRYLQAGSVTKQAPMLEAIKEQGRIIEMTEGADGKIKAAIEVPPKPARDFKIDNRQIAKTMQAEGMDITAKEVRTIFGAHAEDSKAGQDADLIGLEGVFDAEGLPEEAYHDFEKCRKPHERIAQVMVIYYKCKRCAFECRTTTKHQYDVCGE